MTASKILKYWYPLEHAGVVLRRFDICSGQEIAGQYGSSPYVFWTEATTLLTSDSQKYANLVEKEKSPTRVDRRRAAAGCSMCLY